MKRRDFLQLTLASAALAQIPGSLFGSQDAYFNSELADHVIEKVLIKEVGLRYPRLVGKNSSKDIHGTVANARVAQIFTAAGASGWGMLSGNAEQATAYVTGKKVSHLFNPQQGTLQKEALAFDFALHDLAGVILKKPVYELIGKATPITTKCYSGMIYFDDLEPKDHPAGIDAILKNCKWDYEYGYRQFKVKIGRGGKWMNPADGLQRDIEVTKEIAKAFPDCEILIDGNDMFSIDTLIKYLEGISNVPLFWIEEPFVENEKDYLQLRNWLKSNGRKNTLIADGEANPKLDLALDLAKKKLLDVYLEDIQGLGFTKWRTLNPKLKGLGITTSPHCWGQSLKTHYTAHLIGAQGNCPTIEGVTCLTDDIENNDFKLKNGKLVPNSGHGFGLTLLK